MSLQKRKQIKHKDKIPAQKRRYNHLTRRFVHFQQNWLHILPYQPPFSTSLYLFIQKQVWTRYQSCLREGERERDQGERRVTCPPSTSTCNYGNIYTFGINVCTKVLKICFLVKGLINKRRNNQVHWPH